MSTPVFPYEYATILCELLRGAPSGKPYRLSAMYIEFVNGGTITPPVPERDEGLSYYAGLTAAHADRDYLRVPLTAITLTSSNETDFPDGNLLTCIAATAGTGVHSVVFGNTSYVYGGALVATPDFDDPTQDLVLLRFYYDPADQLVKQSGSQLVISQPVQFS
jgi:hypothetical protein